MSTPMPAGYEAGIVFEPGRYYYGMCYQSFKPVPGVMPHGADFMGMLWHFDSKPSEWVFTSRTRRYSSADKAWDGQDVKSWFEHRLDRPKAEMLQKINSVMREMGAVFGSETVPEWVIIEGDVNRAPEAFLAAKKPWMHMRKMDLDKDGKIKGIETDIKAEEPNQ